MLPLAPALLLAGLAACSGGDDVPKAEDTAAPPRREEKPPPPPRSYDSPERRVTEREIQDIQLLCSMAMDFVRDGAPETELPVRFKKPKGLQTDWGKLMAQHFQTNPFKDSVRRLFNLLKQEDIDRSSPDCAELVNRFN